MPKFEYGKDYPFAAFMFISSLYDDQTISCQRYIPRRHQQAPNQDETADHTADDEAESGNGNSTAKGSSTRDDPKTHPMQSKGQTT